MKAPSKSVPCEGNTTLTTLVELYDEINTTSAHLKVLKEDYKINSDAIKEESKKVFDADLGYIEDDAAPAIYGNHEYLVDGRLVTVNYKMEAGGLSFTKIGGYPAKDVLTKLVPNEKDYNKLFTERVKLLDGPEDFEVVAKTRPDLVQYRLNASKLPEDALTLIRSKWPEAFSISLVDEEKYIAEVESAKTVVEVQTKTGLLSALAGLGEDVKYNLRDFIRKVLASSVTSAVKCGNKAEA